MSTRSLAICSLVQAQCWELIEEEYLKPERHRWQLICCRQDKHLYKANTSMVFRHYLLILTMSVVKRHILHRIELNYSELCMFLNQIMWLQKLRTHSAQNLVKFSISSTWLLKKATLEPRFQNIMKFMLNLPEVM